MLRSLFAEFVHGSRVGRSRTVESNQTCFCAPADHPPYMSLGHRSWQQHLTRREFLKGSAALAACFAAKRSPLAAANPAAGTEIESGLLLPPLLTRPTGTSIRISAMNHEKAVEAVVELRKEAAPDWERPQPAFKVPPYNILDWKLQDLVPATRYEYRLLLKQGSDESLRQAATGSFTTQRKDPASYTALLMTDPHTGYFPPGSGPVLTLDRVVQNASRAKAEFVLDLGDNVAWAGSREFPQTNSNGALSAYARYFAASCAR